MKLSYRLLLAPALSLAFAVSPLSAGAIVGGALANTLPSVDDTSASPVNMGFSVNFFGTTYNSLSVNENGNISFADSPGGDSDFGVGSLDQAGRPVIAPFFADVDTSGPGSSQITYGNLTVDGHNAFAVDYENVGYFPSSSDKLNSFQVLLINTGGDDFTVEFNYDQIQWEAGLASGGIDGLGGGSAVAGYSSTGDSSGVTYELPGSAVNGALLDGGPNSLVAGSINARDGVAGRYDFDFVDGSPVAPAPEPVTSALTAGGLMLMFLILKAEDASGA